jgi:hypothetical protein
MTSLLNEILASVFKDGNFWSKFLYFLEETNLRRETFAHSLFPTSRDKAEVRLELILRLPGPSRSAFRVNSHDHAKSARSLYSLNQLALKAESRKIFARLCSRITWLSKQRAEKCCLG